MHEHGCGQMRVFCAQTEPNVVAACSSSAPARSVSPVAFPTAAWCSRCKSPVLALCDIRLKSNRSSPFVVVSEKTTRERDPSCVREPLPTTRVHTCHKENDSFSSTHTHTHTQKWEISNAKRERRYEGPAEEILYQALAALGTL